MKKNKIALLLLMLLISPVCTKPMYGISMPGQKVFWAEHIVVLCGLWYWLNTPTSHKDLKVMVNSEDVSDVKTLWLKHFDKVEEDINKAETMVKDLSKEKISGEGKCYIFLQHKLSEIKKRASGLNYSKDDFYRDVVQIEKTKEHPLCKEMPTDSSIFKKIIPVEDQVNNLKNLYSEAMDEDKRHQEKEQSRAAKQQEHDKKFGIVLRKIETKQSAYFDGLGISGGVLFCAISAIIAIGYILKKKIEDKLLPINNACTPENQIQIKQTTDLINTLRGKKGVDGLYQRINGMYQGIIEQEAKLDVQSKNFKEKPTG
jgi:hypothetical protein